MENALNRIRKQGDPFKNYFQTKSIQTFGTSAGRVKGKK